MELGIRDLLICNDLSGRADHALGLVQNLLLAHKQGLQAKILTGSQELFFLPPRWETTGRKGCLLSLIAWRGKPGLKPPRAEMGPFRTGAEG